MTGDQIASLAYLGLLGGALVIWFVITDRARLGQNMRNLALWGLIFLGVIAAVGLWDDIRATVAPQQAVFAQEGRIEDLRIIGGFSGAGADKESGMILGRGQAVSGLESTAPSSPRFGLIIIIIIIIRKNQETFSSKKLHKTVDPIDHESKFMAAHHECRCCGKLSRERNELF